MRHSYFIEVAGLALGPRCVSASAPAMEAALGREHLINPSSRFRVGGVSPVGMVAGFNGARRRRGRALRLRSPHSAHPQSALCSRRRGEPRNGQRFELVRIKHRGRYQEGARNVMYLSCRPPERLDPFGRGAGRLELMALTEEAVDARRRGQL